MKTRQIAFDSVLAAMCAVLGTLALDFGNLKITFEDVPVLIGALMFGAPEGSAIGFVGTFIYQIIRYGFTATTFLWILPYCLCGLFVGLYAKRRGVCFCQALRPWGLKISILGVHVLNNS